jgi:cytochrome c oxidase subunit 4
MAPPATRAYYGVFALLVVLLAVTLAVAKVDLGRWNFPVAAAIATVKAGLIALYFMHLRYSAALTWLVAGAGVFWLGILVSLTFSDYWTRRGDEGPRQLREPHAASAADRWYGSAAR